MQHPFFECIHVSILFRGRVYTTISPGCARRALHVCSMIIVHIRIYISTILDGNQYTVEKGCFEICDLLVVRAMDIILFLGNVALHCSVIGEHWFVLDEKL